MSGELYRNKRQQFVSVDSQGGCELCGSHSVGLADRLVGSVRGSEQRSGQEPAQDCTT